MGARLTVGKLKELIKELPDDMPVSTEGCDCCGPSDGATVEDPLEDSSPKYLLINRNDMLED